MNPHLLVPIHVDACRVTSPFAAPALADAPFSAGSRPVAAGVWVHWALPDALTHGEAREGAVHLPAVPDRYLVVRLSPPTLGPRGARAWCVDAWSQTVQPVGAWPAASADSRPCLTAIGPREGGRVVDPDSLDESLFAHAYAPEAAHRFALHDPLDDLPPGADGFSYVVIGHYSRPDEDPLRQAGASARSREQAARLRADWCRQRGLAVTGLDAWPPVVLPTAIHALGPASGVVPPPWLAGLAGQTQAVVVAATPAKSVMLESPLFPHTLWVHGACLGVGPGAPVVSPAPRAVALHSSQRQAAVDLADDADAAAALSASLAGVSDLRTATGLGEVALRVHAADFVAHAGRDAEDARYFRPAACVVTVQGIGRVFRHGHDGRLDALGKPLVSGQLKARTGDEIVHALRADARKSDVDRASLRVQAADLFAGALPGQPPLALDLVREACLFDPGGIDRMVVLSLMGRDGSWATPARTALAGLLGSVGEVMSDASPFGFDQPSPSLIARQRHVGVFQPLFLEVEAASALESGDGLAPHWPLGHPDLERAPTLVAPALDPPRVWIARRPLAAAVSDRVASLLKLTAAERADLISTALTGLDDALGAPLRTGTLTLRRVRAVDLFGRTLDLVGPGAAALPSARLALTDLPPRLTSWARLNVRFTSPDPDPALALRGFVRLDFVDHALEVADPRGASLGQLEARGTQVRWVPSPLAPDVDPARPVGDPRRVVAPELTELLGLIDALHRPDGDAPIDGHTRHQAFVDVITRARETTRRDPTTTRLFDRPLALVAATARLDVRPTTGDPVVAPSLAAHVAGLAIGLAHPTQPGDGVYGYFPGADFSQLCTPRWAGMSSHPFTAGPTPLPLRVDAPTPFVLLMDPLATVHVASGVQPVKVLTLPTAWVDAALAALRPSLPFGPLLLPGTGAHLPPPHAPGLTWAWARRTADDAGVVAEVEPLKSADSFGYRDGVTRAEDGWLVAAAEAEGDAVWPKTPVRIRDDD